MCFRVSSSSLTREESGRAFRITEFSPLDLQYISLASDQILLLNFFSIFLFLLLDFLSLYFYSHQNSARYNGNYKRNCVLLILWSPVILHPSIGIMKSMYTGFNLISIKRNTGERERASERSDHIKTFHITEAKLNSKYVI